MTEQRAGTGSKRPVLIYCLGGGGEGGQSWAKDSENDPIPPLNVISLK